MKKVLVLLLFVLSVFGYQWPMMDTLGKPDNKIVESNFGDYRSGHIHEGIDIPPQPNALQDSLYIWPIDSAIVVFGRTTYNVRIRRYTSSFTNPTNEGWRYLHAYTEGICEVGDTLLLDDPVAKGWQFDPNYPSHLHLEYRLRGGDTLKDSKNPFMIDSLCVKDTIRPILNHLYVDYSCHGNATVANLNFLGYKFDSLFRDTTYQGITFKKLKLPAETPFNDLDDPHILVSGNRKVRFVLGGHDNFFKTSDMGAPYELNLFLAMEDTTLGVYLFYPYYTLRFDSLLGSSDEVHQEEDVYHVSAPLISGIDAPQYYRLYPCDSAGNGLPGCIITGSTVLKTEDLDEGMHRIQIYAKDYQNYTKTADVHFYIRKSNWVDFCRGFEE